MKVASLLFALSTGIFCTAQSPKYDSLSTAKEQKSASVEYMSHFIGVRLSQNNNIEELSVQTPSSEVWLAPNINNVSKLSLNYRFISFSLKFVPKFLPGNDDNSTKGSTKSGGFGFNLNFHKWLQELSYSNIKGFYLSNTKDFRPGWQDGDAYLQFPQLQYRYFQGSTAYKFNPNFSINALTTQTERQLKSAGSFMPYLLYRYQIIDDKTPLSGTNTSQKSNTFEIITAAGYAHTFVLNRQFYISLGGSAGVGLVSTHLKTRTASQTISTKQNNAIVRMDGNAGLGYNGQRFFSGIYLRLTSAAYNQQNTSAVSHEGSFSGQVFIGYRLHAPRWLKEKVDNASQLINR